MSTTYDLYNICVEPFGKQKQICGEKNHGNRTTIIHYLRVHYMILGWNEHYNYSTASIYAGPGPMNLLFAPKAEENLKILLFCQHRWYRKHVVWRAKGFRNWKKQCHKYEISQRDYFDGDNIKRLMDQYFQSEKFPHFHYKIRLWIHAMFYMLFNLRIYLNSSQSGKLLNPHKRLRSFLYRNIHCSTESCLSSVISFIFPPHITCQTFADSSIILA